MRVAIVMNRFGHIEVWLNRKTERQADIYLQSQEQVENMIENMPKRWRRDLDQGWLVRCNVPDEVLGY